VDSSRCVVVVDDDVRFIRFVERALGCEGIRVEPITTDCVDEGLKIVEALAPLAALVDIFMYDAARGYDFIERLRSAPATRPLPIIVASGNDRELRRRAAWFEELGCEALCKPFSADELIDLVLRPSLLRRPARANGNGRPRHEPAAPRHAVSRWLERARARAHRATAS
jgi:CheY-like chemotaxis protein